MALLHPAGVKRPSTRERLDFFFFLPSLSLSLFPSNQASLLANLRRNEAFVSLEVFSPPPLFPACSFFMIFSFFFFFEKLTERDRLMNRRLRVVSWLNRCLTSLPIETVYPLFEGPFCVS